ncbi:MAG: hypothetical protein KDD60_00840 [Bdellovibrionales bacterium]|nr:hypothetical protein [Bdellovibrionales bacterium]
MYYALVAIWVLLPLIFFLFALWSYLEQSTQVAKGKKRNQEPHDLLRQGLFVTACSIIAFLIDTFVIMGGGLDWVFGEWIPQPLVRFVAYPFILYVAAMAFGGSKAPRIEKAPRPSERYKYSKKK